MGILSNSNKRKPDFESLKSLIPRLLQFLFTKLNACCFIVQHCYQPAQQAFGSSGRKRERARARETCLSPRVSPSRAPVFSCGHYFQAPATQVTLLPPVTCITCDAITKAVFFNNETRTVLQLQVAVLSLNVHCYGIP